MENMDLNKSNKVKKKYLIYVVLAVVVLVGTVIAISYAYYNFDPEKPSSLVNVNSSLQCIDLVLSDNNTSIGLSHNYPVTDEVAVINSTPLTITVTNNCVNNLNNVDYTLTLTSLANAGGYITDNKIRTSVTRNIESESVYLNPGYLSNLKLLNEGETYTILNRDLDTREGVSTYQNRNSYVLDSSSLGVGATITYEVYLWVDYYEGDAEAYNGVEHDESYDNSTEGQKFAAAVSLIVDNKVEIDHRLPEDYQEVEYIESEGTEYLEIDFIANQDTITKAKYQLTNTSTASMLFGSRVSYNRFYGFNWGGGYIPYHYYNAFYQSEITNKAIDNNIHDLYKDKAKLYIDDVELSTNTTTVTEFTSPTKMIIFGCNSDGVVGYLSSAKIFYMQFYENDTLKIDLVPCYRKSDGKPGMYDLVNDVFYTNLGTGDFSVGHVVS